MNKSAVSSWKVNFWVFIYVAFGTSFLLILFWTLGSKEEIDTFLEKQSLSGHYRGVVLMTYAVFLFSGAFSVFKLKTFITNYRISSNLNHFLCMATTLSDDKAIEVFASIGLSVSRDKVSINTKVFRYASPKALAKAFTFLLYIESRSSLRGWMIDEYTVFHRLADLLLENTNDEFIKIFVWQMKSEKSYLGNLLDAALVRRDLEREANSLYEQINRVIAKERSILEEGQETLDKELRTLQGMIAAE